MIGETRQLITRVVLASLVAGGAWYLLVRPLHQRADLLHTELADGLDKVTSGEIVIDTCVQNPEVVLSALRQTAEAYDGWWGGAAQEARFYDAIRDIARDAGVQLVGVEPGRTQTRFIGEGKLETDARLRIESSVIDANGDFAHVLAFITALQRGLGAVRVDSFHLGPLDGYGTLHVQLNTSRYCFEHPFPSLESREVTP
ncbi:MAG: hypothetical protein H6810_11430 [Phycisphaeraceae bacterium]|nr:MAG: hypothetical protein H6810_11430 [Phycisphaeraceae bacterium]